MKFKTTKFLPLTITVAMTIGSLAVNPLNLIKSYNQKIAAEQKEVVNKRFAESADGYVNVFNKSDYNKFTNDEYRRDLVKSVRHKGFKDFTAQWELITDFNQDIKD